MSLSEFREATAVKVILHAETLETVGWLYEWDNGQFATFWLKGKQENVVFKTIPSNPTKRMDNLTPIRRPLPSKMNHNLG